MDANDLVARIRDHYIKQFRRFVEGQRAACSVGAAEVKLQLREGSGLFQNFYCVDFVRNDDGSEIFELSPETFLAFEPISASFGRTNIRIDDLRWDDVVITHDVDELPEDRLADWFRHWFDLDDARHDPEAELSGIIHSLGIKAGNLSLDFGSAPEAAFWELLHILEAAGATEIILSSSRTDRAPVQ